MAHRLMIFGATLSALLTGVAAHAQDGSYAREDDGSYYSQGDRGNYYTRGDSGAYYTRGDSGSYYSQRDRGDYYSRGDDGTYYSQEPTTPPPAGAGYRNPDGSFSSNSGYYNRDGSYYNRDGSFYNRDGSYRNADGSFRNSDGTYSNQASDQEARAALRVGERVEEGYPDPVALSGLPSEYRGAVPSGYRSRGFTYTYDDDSLYVVDPSNGRVVSVIDLP